MSTNYDILINNRKHDFAANTQAQFMLSFECMYCITYLQQCKALEKVLINQQLTSLQDSARFLQSSSAFLCSALKGQPDIFKFGARSTIATTSARSWSWRRALFEAP